MSRTLTSPIFGGLQGYISNVLCLEGLSYSSCHNSKRIVSVVVLLQARKKAYECLEETGPPSLIEMTENPTEKNEKEEGKEKPQIQESENREGKKNKTAEVRNNGDF